MAQDNDDRQELTLGEIREAAENYVREQVTVWVAEIKTDQGQQLLVGNTFSVRITVTNHGDVRVAYTRLNVASNGPSATLIVPPTSVGECVDAQGNRLEPGTEVPNYYLTITGGLNAGQVVSPGPLHGKAKSAGQFVINAQAHGDLEFQDIIGHNLKSQPDHNIAIITAP